MKIKGMKVIVNMEKEFASDRTVVGSHKEAYYPFVIVPKTSKPFGFGMKYFRVLFNGKMYSQHFHYQDAVSDACMGYEEHICALAGITIPYVGASKPPKNL